jgi:hypothetical protein
MKFIAVCAIIWGASHGIIALVLQFTVNDSTAAERTDLRSIGWAFVLGGCILWQLSELVRSRKSKDRDGDSEVPRT